MKVSVFLVFTCLMLVSACATSPASTPFVVPTAVPVPTNVPAAAPTVTILPSTATSIPPTIMATTAPTRTPAAAAGNTSLACTNPFFPVNVNAKWQYRLSAPSITAATASLTRTISNITANSFVERNSIDNTNVDTTWTCNNGALTSTALANLGNLTRDLVKLQTTRNTGVTIPRSEEWEVGTTWKDTFDVTGQLETNLANLSGNGTAEASNRIAAEQTVVVPAGTFRAFRVDSTIVVRLRGSGGGASTPISVTIAQAAWFARNVGLVKAIQTIASESVTTELTSTNLVAARAPTAVSKPTGAPAAASPAPTGMLMPTPAATGQPSAGSQTVSLKNLAFSPNAITVRVGTTVTWTNNETGPIPHTVTSGSPGAPSGVFDSGTLNPGQSFHFTFNTPGTFPYFCRIHGAAMMGVVTVTP